MAIVNMTPDSFSDGGRFVLEGAGPATSVALRQCQRWLEAGASVLDVGGESTRPGAEPVGVDQECARVLPLIEALRADQATAEAVISIDTRHAAVAQAALEAGADIVNDVSGLADPAMAQVVARFGAGLVIGHMRGTPKTMQRSIHFDDLFKEVADEMKAAIARAHAAGLAHDHIVVDPCVGFGKTAEQSAALVASASHFERATGRPVLIGASRKSFLSNLMVRHANEASAAPPAEDRGPASAVAAVMAAVHGAAMVRVHDIEESLEALAVSGAIEGAYRSYSGAQSPGAPGRAPMKDGAPT